MSSDMLLSEGNDDDDETAMVKLQESYQQVYDSLKNKSSAVSPHVVAPFSVDSLFCTPTAQTLIQEYLRACQLYSTQPNSGVLTTIRYHLPALRVSGPFHDADMLALAELLLRYINGPLSYVRRLDFARASKEGRAANGKFGFRSHGALALAKVLSMAHYVQEVRMQRHKIGPYGASALFLAANQNASLRSLVLRRCQIGERGAIAFAEIICPSKECGLQFVDLSANTIGFRGCLVIEQALANRGEEDRCLEVDLEGNHVFQEIMNGVTHGLGIVLAIMGSILLMRKAHGRSMVHVLASLVYSVSLLLLYTSSTLFHSFFTMQNTRYIFAALDKCAIYILIAASYTPFLQILLGHVPMWSVWLLLFIWSCCIAGIYVEAALPGWKRKGRFSLLMYLGMGWAAIVCMPDVISTLPPRGVQLIVLGGVAYTSGVPFFVRNNNLDHSIWHLFVLSGSIFHWLAVYLYVLENDHCGNFIG
jgi:hemolysin III